MPLWIVFSLSAMLCEVAKVLIIRKLCTGIHSRLVVLASRLISAAILLPMLFICGIGFPLDGMFWLVILTTALITFAGSIWITEAIQFGNLTIVMPMQAAVPVFSLLTLWLGWHETPKNESVLYMLLSMAAVGWTLYAANRDKSSAGKSIYTLLSLAAAVLFGISTILDRVAINRIAQGALAYTACWNLFSAFLMAGETYRVKAFQKLTVRTAVPLLLYGLAATGAFLTQQYAVQYSKTIAGAVVNVKSLVMLHLPIIVLLGLVALKERPKPMTLTASLSAILLAFLLVRSLL